MRGMGTEHGNKGTNISFSYISISLYISFINNRYLFPSRFVPSSKNRITKPFVRFLQFRKNGNKLGNRHRNWHGNKLGTGCCLAAYL